MWIMLIKKLPTVVSPPKMSIFWSTAWPYMPVGVSKAKERRRKSRAAEMIIENYENNESSWGVSPDAKNARRIYYKNENIRVWPHEFTEMTNEKMKMYILDEQCHDLVKSEYIEQSDENKVKQANKAILDEITKLIYDAALLDGCNENQAKMVALGMDVTLEDPEFPVIGWYRIKDEAGLYFCDERELEETDNRESVLT